MTKQFEGKVAIVTGASSGIGQATALLYAEHGAKVVVANRSESSGMETVNLIRSKGGEAAFVQTDVSKAEDAARLVKETIALYGQLNVVCNNAGMTGDLKALIEYDNDRWKEVMDTNISSMFYCMKYQIPELLKTKGSIVNMTSILGQAGMAGGAPYVASKHAIVGITKVAALEYAPYGVRVNCIGPGFIQTPFIELLGPEMIGMLASKHPLGRLGSPEEVAELVIWLSSDKASFATGGYYPLDGGYLAQ